MLSHTVFVVSTISNLKLGVTQKRGTCTKLKEQLQALERETAGKLAELDRYNKGMQVEYSNSTAT